jgi:hypothetical protein
MGVLDNLPAGHTPQQFDHALMQSLRCAMRTYKMARSVRALLWRYSAELRLMAERTPDAHDELILEFVGRLDELT